MFLLQCPNLDQLVKERRIRVKTEQRIVCSVTEHTIPIIPTLAEISNWRSEANRGHEAESFLEKLLVTYIVIRMSSFLWKTKFPCHIYNNLPLVHILSQINLLHNHAFYFYNLLKTESNLLSIRNKSVPRSKLFPQLL